MTVNNFSANGLIPAMDSVRNTQNARPWRCRNARNIGGRLEAFRDAVAAGQGPVGNILGRTREIIGRERTGENLQTSYEEGGQNSLRSSGDVEARIARLEQQIERLTQEIQQLRSSGSNSQTGSLNAQPGASAPGALDSPPAQSQSLQPPTK